MRSEEQRRAHPAADAVPGGGGEPDDGTLVARYQRDPEGLDGRRALSLLLERYRQRVLLWCWQVVKDRELALDLAQEVLVKAYTKLTDYSDDHRFGAWLFTIARNRCLSELRKRKVALAGEAVLELIADERPRPDEVLEGRLGERELLDLVRETLSPLEQDALRLRCFEGMAVEAITRRLEIQESTGARAVLQRARRRLRTALAAREQDMRDQGSSDRETRDEDLRGGSP